MAIARFCIATDGPRTHRVPASGEQVPVIGMGTWQTFDVGDDPTLITARCQVLKTFFNMGGSMVDSSPMYNSSEQVIGECREILKDDSGLFSATKVWIPGRWLGVKRKRPRIDPYQFTQ